MNTVEGFDQISAAEFAMMEQHSFKRHSNISLQVLGTNNFSEFFVTLDHIFFFHASA